MPEEKLERKKEPVVPAVEAKKGFEVEKEPTEAIQKQEDEKEIIGRLKKVISRKPQDESGVTEVVKSETRKQVEKILEADLAEVYKTLDDKHKEDFQNKGRKLASDLETLIETLKAKARTILELIREWLSVIPGVNRFFLEQESKIKTDRIMTLAKRRKKQIKLKNKNKI